MIGVCLSLWTSRILPQQQDTGLVSPILRRPRPRLGEYTAQQCLATKNTLGESPIWSVQHQTLYWIDAPEGVVWTWNLQDPAYPTRIGAGGTKTTLGCIALLKGSSSSSSTTPSLVVAAEDGFWHITLPSSTQTTPGAVVSINVFTTRVAQQTWICPPPEPMDCTRPNDGRVDRDGQNLVFGMYNNYHRTPIGPRADNCASLYRFTATTTTSTASISSSTTSTLTSDTPSLQVNDNDQMRNTLPPYRVSNCICFSPNGRIMYFCDTPTRKLYAFEYINVNNNNNNNNSVPPQSTNTIRLSNRRLLWTMPSEWNGGPDGAQVGKC